jgi:hypothetical protein
MNQIMQISDQVQMQNFWSRKSPRITMPKNVPWHTRHLPFLVASRLCYHGLSEVLLIEAKESAVSKIKYPVNFLALGVEEAQICGKSY